VANNTENKFILILNRVFKNMPQDSRRAAPAQNAPPEALCAVLFNTDPYPPVGFFLLSGIMSVRFGHFGPGTDGTSYEPGYYI
jgi:hypothetical protein